MVWRKLPTLPEWKRPGSSISVPVLGENFLNRSCSGSDSKASVYNAGDLGSIPGLGRFSWAGNCNPLQYSCLENPMDGGAWCPWGRKELDMTERLRFLSLWASCTAGHPWTPEWASRNPKGKTPEGPGEPDHLLEKKDHKCRRSHLGGDQSEESLEYVKTLMQKNR